MNFTVSVLIACQNEILSRFYFIKVIMMKTYIECLPCFFRQAIDACKKAELSEKETKKIGKFVCKKATTTFRGRNYTAWFTNEIPLPYGPWKLNGLPGLILEAYDSNKFVYWYSKNIEYPSNTDADVQYLSIPIKEKFLTYQEFKFFQKQELEKIEEKSKIMNKQFPQVEFSNIANLKDMFIECE